MATGFVKWTGGKTFIGVDSTNHSVVLSSKEDNVGMKPSELLLVAVGTCSAFDVVDILQKKRLNLKGLEISVQGEQQSEPPWPFKKIHIHYKLTGADITDKDAQQAIELSEQKYCSVAATVRGVAEITTDFEVVKD
jgi:putative redox protein